MFSQSLQRVLPTASQFVQQSYSLNSNSVLRGYIVRCMSDTRQETIPVYYGVLTPQIKAVKVISFTTSIGGLFAQPILLNQVAGMGGSLPVMIGLCSFVGFFTFVTPLLLHFISKKYVTHLDYEPTSKKYIATVLTFFCRKRQIEFDVEDVKVPEIPGMFTSFLVRKQALFVDPSLFSDPAHYGRLMGYDKPIDFKLHSESPPIDKKQKS